MKVTICSSIAILFYLAGPCCLGQGDEVWCDVWDGSRIRDGERTSDDPCSYCTCIGGHLACPSIQCDFLRCIDSTQVPGECCPSCPNGDNCRLPNGTALPAGESAILSNGQVCRCYELGVEADCYYPF